MIEGKRTPLYNFHIARGARMVPFAGYEMPVHYPEGILTEHRHTRNSAGLFDISHMGQILVHGQTALAELEQLMPGDLLEMRPGQVKYSFLLTDAGGVIDDLMVTRLDQETVYLVVNASRKEGDFAELKKCLPSLRIDLMTDQSLLALQGPEASSVFSKFCDAPQRLGFMEAGSYGIPGVGECLVSRSGYTGEDGFEISVPADTVTPFVERLVQETVTRPVGLGARDSLRLEAGLCLFGHDLDVHTTPVDAGLTFAIGKRRRAAGGFRGAALIQKQLREGTTKKRVGIRPEGRALAREGTGIFDAESRKIGVVTSGGFGPTVDGPLAMGYVEARFAAPGTQVFLSVRGRPLRASVTPLPFVPHRYLKGSH